MISEDRQSHLAHLITDGLWKDDLVDYTDDAVALRTVKLGVSKFIQEEERTDQLVRGKISSLKRGVIEGSPEWDVMYNKYYEEEMKKRGTV